MSAPPSTILDAVQAVLDECERRRSDPAGLRRLRAYVLAMLRAVDGYLGAARLATEGHEEDMRAFEALVSELHELVRELIQ